MTGAVWQTVVFDFDGVIADSMPGQDLAFRQAWEREGAAELTATALPVMLRNLWDGCAGFRIFERMGIDLQMQQRLRVSKDEIWRAQRAETPLMAGAVEGLRRLGRDRPLAIATSAHRDYVEALLFRDGIMAAFAVIVTDADVKRGKPAPDPLLEITAKLGVPTGAMLMVGDTITDVEMARAAGSGIAMLRADARYPAPPESVTVYGGWAELVRGVTAAARGV